MITEKELINYLTNNPKKIKQMRKELGITTLKEASNLDRLLNRLRVQKRVWKTEKIFFIPQKVVRTRNNF